MDQLISKILHPLELGYTGIFQYIISIHIALGLVALISGFLILLLTKGSPNHKRIGRVFAVAMFAIFFVAVPLSTFGSILKGRGVNVMTFAGAVFSFTFALSGYRLIKTGAAAREWYDKTGVGLMFFGGFFYLYIAALMVFGTSIFGFSVVTAVGEQFTLLDNTHDLFTRTGLGIVDSNGALIGALINETFVAPLLLSALMLWYGLEDWRRIFGGQHIDQASVISQHLTRLLIAFAGVITATLLNTPWFSWWVVWLMPLVCMLALAAYYQGYSRRGIKPVLSTA